MWHICQTSQQASQARSWEYLSLQEIHSWSGSGMITWKPIFPWQRTGYSQVKYRSKKLMSNPKQGFDRMHHCEQQKYSNWFGSGMIVRKLMNILMEARINAGKYYIPPPSSPSISQGIKTASLIMELIMCNIFIWIQFFLLRREVQNVSQK